MSGAADVAPGGSIGSGASPAGRVDVSVCIVNWNGASVLRQCLESLYRQTSPPTLQIIVVDNASTDGSADIAAEFANVELVRNADNRGFSAGNNLAADRATGSYLFFLNNDTVVPPGAIAALTRYLDSHPQTAAVGPKLIGGDLKPQRSARNLPTLRAMLHFNVLPIRWTCLLASAYRRYRGNFDMEQPGPAPQLAAAALMVRADVFNRIGRWDEQFEFGVEDVDFCKRLTEVGTIQYLPEAHITHLGRISSHMNRGPVYRSYQCGYVRYFRKHHWNPWAPATYKIAITFDTPIRLTLLWLKVALSHLTGRRDQAARSASRAAGVWFFVRHGFLHFWRS